MPLPPQDVDEMVSYLRDPDVSSLPFVVSPAQSGESAAEIQAAVDEAIRYADERAEERVPDDPTSCDLTVLVEGRLVTEIDEGNLEDEEIRAWLADLGRRLDDSGVRVRVSPRPASERVPNIDDWMGLPPTPTAFLYFTDSTSAPLERRIPLSVVETMADPLLAWSRPAGGTVVVRKGLVEVATPAALAVGVLLEGMPIEPPQFGLRRFEQASRRQRSASFDYGARGDMQVLDDSPLVARLDGLLDGVRVLASALDYAYVRRATPVSPSEFDPAMVLGRPMTRMEELAAGGALGGLLAEYAPDVYVAQVLTDSHLAKARNLDRFTIEPLVNGRHLVRARDASAWLDGLNPDPEALETARVGFAEMLLTDEVLAALSG